MTCNDENRGFMISDARFSWTDFQRIKYLERFIRGCTGRLNVLRRSPIVYAESIAQEEARLATAKNELERLKTRAFNA
ncbi:hypothetical protein FJY63_08995 [Candidatus Sumerlaeota bacterium]|nr:hypothetical protein [Candidatus Sumerlaeota bacterium]